MKFSPQTHTITVLFIHNLLSAGMGSSGVLGSEVLRSLVLPGIGKITVVDDATVTETDLGNK